MNCGVCCHNDNVTGTRFQMRLGIQGGGLGAVADTATYQTAINQQSLYTPATSGADVTWYRLRPLDASRSELLYRISVRDDGAAVVDRQMPPLISHHVDPAGIDAVTDWIAAMTTENGYPAPAP